MPAWHSDAIVKTWPFYSHLDIAVDDCAGVLSTAAFSWDAAHQHRYFLSRIWAHTAPPLVVIMCNPSTADHLKNDPTVARMVDFARRWGYGGLIVLNVFAYRAKKPIGVRTSPYPVGCWNSEVIFQTLLAVRTRWPRAVTVCAWGGIAHTLEKQTNTRAVRSVCATLGEFAGSVKALRITDSGRPWHPLYVPASTQPIAFDPSRLL